MKAAPAVQACLPADPLWRFGVALLVGTATVSLLAWLHGHGVFSGIFEASGRWSVVLSTTAGLGLAGLAAALAWRLEGRSFYRLTWDGQSWSCAKPGQSPWACTPVIALDLGSWLLIEMVPLPTSGAGPAPWPGARSSWFALSSRSAAATWHPLRVALQAQVHQRAGGTSGLPMP